MPIKKESWLPEAKEGLQLEYEEHSLAMVWCKQSKNVLAGKTVSYMQE